MDSGVKYFHSNFVSTEAFLDTNEIFVHIKVAVFSFDFELDLGYLWKYLESRKSVKCWKNKAEDYENNKNNINMSDTDSLGSFAEEMFL